MIPPHKTKNWFNDIPTTSNKNIIRVVTPIPIGKANPDFSRKENFCDMLFKTEYPNK